MNLDYYRDCIEKQYRNNPTECGGSFGEILCWEIHTNGLTFLWLAEKWGISVSLLGSLINDHCKNLEDKPVVNHDYPSAQHFVYKDILHTLPLDKPE